MAIIASDKLVFAARWNWQDNPLRLNRGGGPGTGGFSLACLLSPSYAAPRGLRPACAQGTVLALALSYRSTIDSDARWERNSGKNLMALRLLLGITRCLGLHISYHLPHRRQVRFDPLGHAG